MATDNLKKDFNSTPEKKYEIFQDEVAKQLGLYRIRALRDFGDVKKGELGGFVSGEHNLAHEGTCWIGFPAKVTGTTRVSGDAFVGGDIGLHGTKNVTGKERIVNYPHLGIDPSSFGRPQ